MKAVVYRGPGKVTLEEKPKPKLEKSTDCIVKIIKTTICGTDLHIRKGDVPTVDIGRTLGHEGIGVVEEAGSAVLNFKRAIRSSFPASLPVEGVLIVKIRCIPIVNREDGFLATASMEHKLNMFAFLLLTLAFTICLKE